MPRKSRERGPRAVDVHVGSRLRQRRMLLGWSQQRLATALGLTFQQVQKYERGANRIGASRLWVMCAALGVEPNYFFEGLQNNGVPAVDSDTGLFSRRETLELVRNYWGIDDPQQRRAVYTLAKVTGRRVVEA